MNGEDTAVASAGRRRRRPIEPFSSILPASGKTGATNTAGGGAMSMQRSNNHLPNDDVDVSVDALGKSLANFSSKVDGTLHRARHLTGQAEAAASRVSDGSAPSAGSHPAATGTSTAAQFLSDQQNRTNRITQRLEAVADALLQFPAHGDEGDITSLADLTRLCASVYEANAVQLAVVEDAMVHGGNVETESNDEIMLQDRYDGMDARRAAIAAMERRQMKVGPDGCDHCDSSAAGISVHAANVTDDASTIGSLGSLGTEELLTDGIIGDVGTGTGTNSSRTPLGTMSDNTALGDGGSTNHQDSAKISCHYNGLPLEAISEGEAESSSSSSGSSGDTTSAPNNAGVATDGHNKAAIVEKGICSPSPAGLSMFDAVLTPATPATPSLADLHLSQCTIDTLESAQDDEIEGQDGPARDGSRCSSEDDEDELCMAAAPRKSDMEEFIGDGDSIGGSASLLNDSDYANAEDAESSRSDESSLEGDDDEGDEEDFSMAATIEMNPVFEETLMNDGCSVATASPTIVADRKLAQIMAQIARGEPSAEDNFADDDDDDDALSEGSATSSFSGNDDNDDNSTASESSIDRLIDESDHISETNATVVRERDSSAVERGGQTKRKTPILDRYRVQNTSDGYKVSPKDSEAASASPKVLPFGVCSEGEEGASGEQNNQDPITAPQRIQPKSKPKRQPTYEGQGRTRKVYPRTPISRFPVPREEDEDELSETDDESEMATATATPPVKAQGFGRSNQEEEDVTSRRLSSSGGDVPFSPQATSTAIKSKANAATNPITTSTMQSPSETCRTPLAAAWIEKNMPEEKERLLRILSPNERTSAPTSTPSSVTASTTDTRPSSFSKKSSDTDANANLIRHLTPEEYRKAPRIVRSQVSIDEVGAAVTTLNAWLLASPHGQTEINEDQAYGLLGDMFNRRKAKTLCMSLCHWKRLLMRGSSDDDGGLTFQVVLNL